MTSDETFQQSGKTNSCRHILKRSSNTYESWGLQFFKTTTRIQLGPGSNQGLFKTFSARIRVLRKVLIKNCAFLDGEGNTSGLLRRCVISDLTLFRPVLATCCKSQEPSFWEEINSFVLLSEASLAAI